MLNNYYEDLSKVRINTLQNRAYYLPSPPETPTAFREENPRVTLLNGVWDFKFFSRVADFSIDADTTEKIDVPSCIQMKGYDQQQYTNVRYPIPFNPPYVPKENPCCLYRRSFFAQQDGNRYFINLEGVDSCHYLYINKHFVGYSQVSHSTSEYEITNFLNDGENIIEIVVLKWCDGTYLEDQDKLRMTGIFRDVLIIKRPQSFVFDYKYTTQIEKELATIKIACVDEGEKLQKNFELFDESGNKVAFAETDGDAVTLTIKNPTLWNAEAPYLYTLKIHTNDEVILDYIGLRTICVEDKILKVNGKQIKIKGVNRHDSYPDTGYVASTAQVLRDLTIMKQHNINAIRTSHYPNCPEFYRMCDKFGFYVIAECDIEAHGTTSVAEIYNADSYSLIADNIDFSLAICDRVEREVERDKNRASIIFWSLGNESGFGICFKNAIKAVNSLDATRPIHYESTVIPKALEAKGTEKFDGLFCESVMYPSLEWCKEYLNDKSKERPLFLCEYAHAMGNGPGSFKEYYDLFYQYDNFLGGCVWEWCDHVVQTKEGHYLYGGDFGEFPHDGNFCMDGLTYPDRTPHTGLFELKNAARPAQIVKESDDFYLINRLDFLDISELCDIKWTVKQNGSILKTGTMSVHCAPHEKTLLKIDALAALPRSTITFELILKKELPLVPLGSIMGFDQFDLFEFVPEQRATIGKSAIYVEEDSNFITVKGAAFEHRFNKLTGSIDRVNINDELLLDRPMEYDIYRAPTDNDRNIKLHWIESGYDRATVYTYKTTIVQNENGVVISCPLSIQAVYLANIAELQTEWHIYNNGAIGVNIHADIRKGQVFLPRFGLRMFLNSSFNKLGYYGYGPHESYIDKHVSCYKDVFQTTVSNMFENYIKPQENGARYGCSYVSIKNGNNIELRASSSKEFSFNVSEYTREELAAKAHNFELKKSGFTVLNLDYKMSGVGSNSCGPELPERYQLNETEFNFDIYCDFNF